MPCNPLGLYYTELYITNEILLVGKHMLTPELMTTLASLLDFWDLNVWKNSRFFCANAGGWTQLSQVHSESIHDENSSLHCNEGVADDDAAICNEFPSGLLKGVEETTDANSYYGFQEADCQCN